MCDLRFEFSFFLSFFLSVNFVAVVGSMFTADCTRQSWSFGSSIPRERLVSTSVLRRKLAGKEKSIISC